MRAHPYKLPILCTQPSADAILPQLDFMKVKTYTTTPGALNFEQETNCWEWNRESLLKNELKKPAEAGFNYLC